MLVGICCSACAAFLTAKVAKRVAVNVLPTQNLAGLLKSNKTRDLTKRDFKLMTNKPHLTDDHEPNILMCVAVEQMKALYGSIQAHCTKCQAPVWVSESGQKALRASRNLLVYCMECATKQIEADESGEKLQLKAVPGALQELRRYLSKAGDN